MSLTVVEICAVAAALCAVLMAGSLHVKRNIFFYMIQTILLAAATAEIARSTGESSLYFIAVAIAGLKGIFVPFFLRWLAKRLQSYSDPGMMLAPPLAMHASLLLFALSYFELGSLGALPGSTLAAAAAASLLLTGLILMLTRKTALSQIVGFLVIENGIYLFAVTQTSGMPLLVEMGVMLDVLVAVMVAGLIVFRIQQSFEHIDVTQLAELRD